MTRHANRGRAWQLLLEHWHDRYRRECRAVIHPTPPEVRLLTEVSAQGTFRACFRGQGPPDYTGTLAPSGRSVSADAKDCAGTRWPLSKLEAHQAKDLEACHLAGGLALVLLRLGRGYRAPCWSLPWETLREWYWRWKEGEAARGQASLGPADCDAIGHRMPEPGDWLGALP